MNSVASMSNVSLRLVNRMMGPGEASHHRYAGAVEAEMLQSDLAEKTNHALAAYFGNTTSVGRFC